MAPSTPDGALAARTVLLLVGGTSPERGVSLESGRALGEALESLQSQGSIAGYRRIEIEADGTWREGSWTGGPLTWPDLEPASQVALLGLHGGEGEDGTLQGALRLRGLPHTGSGVAASALGMDKWASRLVAQAAGLEVAPGWLVREPADLAGEGGPAASEGGPWFVKPRRGGSSVATSRAETSEQLAEAVDQVLATGDDALVETAVEGTEVTVGVLEGPDGTPRALPLVEIVPSAGRFFDFEEKYSSEGATELCPPRSLSGDRCAAIAKLGLRGFEAHGCEGYARVDLIVPAQGPPVFLEVNTLPGFTPRSLLPQAAAAEGLSFADLVRLVLERAIAR